MLINKNFFLVLFFSIFLSNTAWAYLDPGTGSAIIGLIVSSFVAISIVIKNFWYKIKRLFNFNNKSKKNTK